MSDYPSFQEKYFRKKSGFHHTIDSKPGIAAFEHLDEDFCTDENVHWAFEALRKSVKNGNVRESNDMCREMLKAFKHFFLEYSNNGRRATRKDLEEKLDGLANYLRSSRIITLGMETAIQYLKHKAIQIDPNTEIHNIREIMCEHIENFLNEKIEVPMAMIAGMCSNIIQNSDVVLVYGYSDTVTKALVESKKSGKNFRVIVVDSRTQLDGKKTLKILAGAKIHCTYILISNVSYHMSEVSRVILGAEGIYNNCCLLNTVGTAMITCIANAFRKPVLVCIEIYKMSEKVQMDSFCDNVLYDGNLLNQSAMYEGDTRVSSELKDFVSAKLLRLNLKYDVTPPKYIDMLITEVGPIPVSSVPVVLREFRSEIEIS
jgi:translation initiation factor eIF-2B subunit delta